jgi:hypothetical protein
MTATAAATRAPRVRDRARVRTNCIGRIPLLNVGGIVPTVTVRCRGTGGGGRGWVRIRDHGQLAPSHASQPVRTLADQHQRAQAGCGAKGPSSRSAPTQLSANCRRRQDGKTAKRGWRGGGLSDTDQRPQPARISCHPVTLLPRQPVYATRSCASSSKAAT